MDSRTWVFELFDLSHFGFHGYKLRITTASTSQNYLEDWMSLIYVRCSHRNCLFLNFILAVLIISIRTQETFDYKQSRFLYQKEKADRAKEIHYNVAVSNTLAGIGGKVSKATSI